MPPLILWMFVFHVLSSASTADEPKVSDGRLPFPPTKKSDQFRNATKPRAESSSTTPRGADLQKYLQNILTNHSVSLKGILASHEGTEDVASLLGVRRESSTETSTRGPDSKATQIGFSSGKGGDVVGRAGFSDTGPTVPDEKTQVNLLKIVRDSLLGGPKNGTSSSGPLKSQGNVTSNWEVHPVAGKVGDGSNPSQYFKQPPLCLEKPDPGLCRAYMPRWYYNASNETCRKFAYGGCQGNDNNFLKEHKCYATCKGDIPCPKDPANVCRLSESTCGKAECPAHPEAECTVLPCTCEVVFEDSAGEIVDCKSPFGEHSGDDDGHLGDLGRSGSVFDVPEGRAARPQQKNKTSGNFDITDDVRTKAPATVVEGETNKSAVVLVQKDKSKGSQGVNDSDTSVRVKDVVDKGNAMAGATNYSVIANESGQNVTVSSPKNPGRKVLIGVLVTLSVIALLAIVIIAYKKWRGVMAGHTSTGGFWSTEDRQCFTNSGSTNYGTGF
ncbi:uncharacterized protein [Macrobrachium rosenbergii]|uniref:uncharacterized protein n=1 Tax=Macrobrachium rosenbergii TaxID=79674 RepID=UPI0034D53D20